MKSIKFNYSVLPVVVLTIIVISMMPGCISAKYKTPDLPEWQVATITSSDPNYVRIYEIDGQVATGKLHEKNVSELPGKVVVPAGQHKIVPCYVNFETELVYGDPISFYTRQEEDYTIKYKVKWDETIRFWIEHKGVDITTEY